MACCGSRRSAPGSASPTRGASGVTLEYRGPGPLTVFGSVTGVRYRFAGTGARVVVDPRDAYAIQALRGIQLVTR